MPLTSKMKLSTVSRKSPSRALCIGSRTSQTLFRRFLMPSKSSSTCKTFLLDSIKKLYISVSLRFSALSSLAMLSHASIFSEAFLSFVFSSSFDASLELEAQV